MPAASVGKLRYPVGEESENLKEVVEGVCGRQETMEINSFWIQSTALSKTTGNNVPFA